MGVYHSIKTNQSKKSKTMKKSIVLLTALLFVSFAQAQLWGSKKIKGNGNVTTITRSTSDYDAIHCAGWMDFILVKGNEGNLKIEGESNLLDYIITEVDHGELIIKTKNGINLKPSFNKTIKITIPFKDIEKVTLSGSGDVLTKNATINANDFEVRVSGSGDIDLDVAANSIEAKVTGSGDLTLIGKTNNLKASVTGSGDFHGYKLEADNTEARVTGSGDVEVVSNNTLVARVTGSGDIEYRGNPNKEDTKVTGSGSISN